MKRKTMICVVILLSTSIGLSLPAYKNNGQARLAPRMLNYQGYLTDTQGNPITNPSISMTFNIFDAVSGGNQKWAETQGSIYVDKGIFNVLLGIVTPIPDSVFLNSANRWLQLTVAGQILSPRTQIVSAPYAYMSTYSDTAQYCRNSAPDNDWTRSNGKVYTYNSTDSIGIRTTAPRYALDVDGVICGGAYDTVKAAYGSVLGGYSNLAGSQEADTGATICGGIDNVSSYKYSYIGGGYNNNGSGTAVTIGGGRGNTATGSAATIGGGAYNVSTGSWATVAGGGENSAANCAIVAGGYGNSAGGSWSTIGGGNYNAVSAIYGAILGGDHNTAGDAAADTNAVVVGGRYNIASGKFSFIGGGMYDTVMAVYSSNLGGYHNSVGNEAADTAATVVGGHSNAAMGKYAFVGGGRSNRADSTYATVGGGTGNISGNLYASVTGGGGNSSSGFAATIGGGSGNAASGSWSMIGGGTANTASGYGSVAAGGANNFVSNTYAAAAGGYYDTCATPYGFTAGNNSTVLAGHTGSAAFNGQTSTAAGETRVGILSKASGTFTIDHPLDPENKILNHYFVESPGMTNIYEGEAMLDGSGRCEIVLPVYFDALNRAPRVQLTGVGTSDVYVAEKVKGNRFVIGGKPGTEVYWMVTADRKDPSAELTRILMPVEQPKEGGLANRSLDDELLATTKLQLEQMGKAGGFKFRHATEQDRYEEMKRMLQENK